MPAQSQDHCGDVLYGIPSDIVICLYYFGYFIICFVCVCFPCLVFVPRLLLLTSAIILVALITLSQYYVQYKLPLGYFLMSLYAIPKNVSL